jgi:hypothetical protein
MEGHRSGDISRLQNDPIFPISGVPCKVANGFSATALTAYALELPYTVATLKTIAYDNF